MTTANKNTLKKLSFALLGLGIFIAITYLAPDGSTFKLVFGIILTIALLGSMYWLTALSNPLKKLIDKFKKK